MMSERTESLDNETDGEGVEGERAGEFSSKGARAPDASSTAEDGMPGQRGLGVSDVLRKAVVTGLSAAIMTEEGVRSVLKELKLPKEAVSSALEQAERGRGEVVRIVNEEVRRFLDSPALKREIARALSNITIELTAKIRLNPDGKGPEVSFGQPQIRREPAAEAADDRAERPETKKPS